MPQMKSLFSINESPAYAKIQNPMVTPESNPRTPPPQSGYNIREEVVVLADSSLNTTEPMETEVHLSIEEEPRPSTSTDFEAKDPTVVQERCKITLPSSSTEKIRKSTRTRHTPISLADDYFITSSEANKRMRSSNVVSTNTVKQLI